LRFDQGWWLRSTLTLSVVDFSPPGPNSTNCTTPRGLASGPGRPGNGLIVLRIVVVGAAAAVVVLCGLVVVVCAPEKHQRTGEIGTPAAARSVPIARQRALPLTNPGSPRFLGWRFDSGGTRSALRRLPEFVN